MTKGERQKVKGTNSTSVRLYSAFLFFLLPFAFCLREASAQPETPDTVPPPAKVLSKDIKDKLLGELDEKKRVEYALTLMDSFLDASETGITNEVWEASFRELGSFHFVMDNTLDFLIRRDTGSGKIRNAFKKYEIGLRAFAPRLELIRRDLPSRFEPYVFRLIKNVRETRTKAIEPLFGSN
ncbi:MAG TPA: hypothetical protein PKA82_10395 [Pyrinomonadaceae bacterium]|nr:hypothetical protein [Pyrinomonadaceae bacterium]